MCPLVCFNALLTYNCSGSNEFTIFLLLALSWSQISFQKQFCLATRLDSWQLTSSLWSSQWDYVFPVWYHFLSWVLFKESFYRSARKMVTTLTGKMVVHWLICSIFVIINVNTSQNDHCFDAFMLGYCSSAPCCGAQWWVDMERHLSILVWRECIWQYCNIPWTWFARMSRRYRWESNNCLIYMLLYFFLFTAAPDI